MNDLELRGRLRDGRIVAIVRSDDSPPERLVDIVVALDGAGIRLIELPLTNPTALEAIAMCTEIRLDAVIGAGTVMSATEAKRVADAGGTFIVTPNVNPDVVGAAQDLGLGVFAGAFSPTEIALARSLEVAGIKIFPASVLGPQFVAAVLGPFPDAVLVPTGGITVENAPAYLGAGAWGLGVGGKLIGDGDPAGVAERARTLLSVVAHGRTQT